MNPRESMARLGPSTVKFDIGRGDKKLDLTNQDIAAVLGMVSAGLGRVLLEACWWPDGVALRRHRLREAVIADDAGAAAAAAAPCRNPHGFRIGGGLHMGWAAAVTVERRAERDRAAHRLGQIEVQCWPISTLESLPTLAMALIGEITHRPHGTSCEGGTSPRLESCWWRAKSEVAEALAR